jgi:alpha-L-arabinofuranosidase
MGYNWQDGIGPKEQRPMRIDMAWGVLDNNHVGTDEWVKLNKSMGSENIVCVNLGLGTIMDAAWWVEYCNYKGGTYYSDLRAKNGYKEPYNVRIWDIGNEVDGMPWKLGHKNAEDRIEYQIIRCVKIKYSDLLISCFLFFISSILFRKYKSATQRCCHEIQMPGSKKMYSCLAPFRAAVLPHLYLRRRVV